MTTIYDPSDAVSPRRWERDDDPAFFAACQRGDVLEVERGLAKGHGTEGFDEDGFRPLHLACAGGHLSVVRCLLRAGANVDATSAHPGCFAGMQPLHAAVAGDRLDVIELLLAHGASLEATDEAGFTPLHLAVTRSSVDVVRRLLAAGADPSREVADSCPVVLAIRRGNRALSALLRQVAHTPCFRAD